MQILATDALKHNKEIATRYNDIRKQIFLALVRFQQQELEETLGIAVSEEKPSDSESEDYIDVESVPNTERDSESAIKNESKMTTALEVIKTASTLIPEFDGNSDHSGKVINAIKALSTLITEGTKVTVIQAILSKLVRISQHVRPWMKTHKKYKRS